MSHPYKQRQWPSGLRRESLRPLTCWECGFESSRGHGCLSVVGVVCLSDRGLVQRSPTDCVCVTVCDLETSRMRRPWPALGCCASQKKNCTTINTNLLVLPPSSSHRPLEFTRQIAIHAVLCCMLHSALTQLQTVILRQNIRPSITTTRRSSTSSSSAAVAFSCMVFITEDLFLVSNKLYTYTKSYLLCGTNWMFI
jgi:hypothetical protein